MEKFYKRLLGPLLITLLTVVTTLAQTTISGTVKDSGTGESLPGVSILVKDQNTGTITNTNGEFSLKVSRTPPFTLVFSFIGLKTQEIEITDANTTNLNITLEEASNQLVEVIVTGGRKTESYLKAASTVEVVDRLAIQAAPAPDYFDALANVKGVQASSGSLNFTQVNTRGFATIANVRFVQLVDGMDTSAPLLNFPTGNIVGIGELDAESMELVPGAASALYGPNAFNGILLMKSKSPFEFQGLSAQFKGGITKSDADGSNPLYNFGLRYAKAFNNKFAFKVNFSMLTATDWLGNDYTTSRVSPESTIDLTGQSNFDGLNLYGDETEIPVPIGGTFGTLDLRRTGFKEEDILDNHDAKSIKYDAALHYRITDNMEILYNYRFGGGSSVYQGTEKYALRDFTQQFHKIELKAKNYFVRAYMTETKDGDSWNMSAQGGYANEYYNPTVIKDSNGNTIGGWAPEYAQTYVLAMQGYWPGTPAGDQAAAHAAARAYADRNRPAVGTPEYAQLMKDVRANLFQRNPPGSSFVDNSKLYHAEFNYNFAKIEFAEIMVGGNFRSYSLFSDGTVFNEDPEGDGVFDRVNINEGGVYAQIAKNVTDALKLTGSVRYDKNENFDGRVTPRLSAVYSVNETHNIRASFQTGFRNPDSQAQFIYFPSSSGTLLGSTQANAEHYGVHNGGAWTQESYNTFRANGGTLDPTTGAVLTGDPNDLVTANIKYVEPEQLKSFEIGYKGVFSNTFAIDFNTYYTSYQNFIGSEIVAIKQGTTHQGVVVPAGIPGATVAGSLYSPYVNKEEDVTFYGVGLGVSYYLPKGYTVDAGYTYATFDTDAAPGSNFRAGFNTPENKFNIGIGNRKLIKNLGFNVTYRWQEGFLWESSYGSWNVPEFGVMDAQISYKISSIKTIAKLGGTNIIGGDYRTNLGSPFVGQQFYISLTFDEFFK